MLAFRRLAALAALLAFGWGAVGVLGEASALASVTTSYAAPVFTELPEQGGRVYANVTIGDRYVVYEALAPGQTLESPPGTPLTVSITDTLTMTTRQLNFGDCALPGYRSVHDLFPFRCGGAYLYDAATMTPAVGVRPLPTNNIYLSVNAVGDQWIEGDFIRSPKPAERLRVYYNWRSGKVRWLNIVKHPDLDDPKLGTAVNCAPFQRTTRIPSFYGQPISSYVYNAPQDGRTAYLMKGKGSHRAMYAGRCGGTGRLTKVHPINLSTIDPGSITNGWSAWASRSGCQLNSYDDATHHIYQWTTWPAKHPCVDIIGKTKYAVVTRTPAGTVEPYIEGRDAEPITVYQLAIAPRPQ